MWQERQAELLKDEIKAILAPLADVGGLCELVTEPLAKVRRGLAAEGMRDRPWPLLPLMVCEAISGRYKHVLPVAASLQLFMVAGDVYDDIEDADSSESLSTRYGLAVAVNVATVLLVLAEGAIARLDRRGVDDNTIIRVMDTVNSLYTTACAGQHLELSLTSETDVSEDIYLTIIGMKSASQIECACRVGALLATTNQELIDTFAMFGNNLGMAAQITNDIQGVTYGSDIAKRKKTLPVIYALSHADAETRSQLELAFSRQSEPMPDPTLIRGLLFRAGAIHYTTIKMEFYKQRALDIISEAESEGANVERLKLFLE